MKLILSIIITIALLVTASSCCFNKKACYWPTNMEITFLLNEDVANGGFNSAEMDALQYIFFDPSTQTHVDTGSFRNHLRAKTDIVNPGLWGFFEADENGGKFSLKNKHLIVFLPGTNYSDTIFNIHFFIKKEKKSCGDCLVDNTYQEVLTVTNRTAMYRNRLFTENEFPITITKK